MLRSLFGCWPWFDSKLLLISLFPREPNGSLFRYAASVGLYEENQYAFY